MSNLKSIILAGVLAFLVLPTQAQWKVVEKVAGSASDYVIPYEKYVLENNGLTLIIHEDHSDPIVHVQVAYHVGSARESVRNSGFAHFFEHMMFQGSKNVADEEHFKIISEAGGTNNAFTSFDKTVYVNTAPSNLTETLLWLEADRMGTHLEGFTETKFNNQRDAVKNEKRQRYDNQPYGMVSENLFKTVFPNHPYEWTPIGYVDDLDIASFDDLRNFFLRWYGPNNATLVVSGDVNPVQVKQWAEKYFKSIPSCPEVKKQRAATPILPTDVYVPMTDNIWLPLTMMTFPTVKEYHRDEAALDILAEALGGGNNSLLYKNFVKTEDAVQASAGHSALELAGMFQIQVVANFMGMGFNDVEKRIRETLEEFNTKGISSEELERIKASLLSGAIDQLNSVSSKALLLSHWNMMKGETYNMKDEIERYSNVTAEDVMRVFRRYVYNQKAVIINVSREAPKEGDDQKPKSINPHAHEQKKADPQYEGLSYKPLVDDFDRSLRPSIPKGAAVKLPAYFTQNFDNGAKVIGSSTDETPKVYFYLEFEGGHLLEADKKIKSGTASITAELLNEGPAGMSSEEFSAELDRLGSRISFGSGVTSTTVFVSTMKENVDATLELLSKTLNTPRFDPNDFRRVKKQYLEGIKSRKSDPNWMARSTMNSILYEGSILAEDADGDFKSIDKMSVDDCKSFFERFYSPNVLNVAVVGDLSKEEILSKLVFVKDMKSKNVVVPEPPAAKAMQGTTLVLVDKPYAAQSLVVAAFPSSAYSYNGDYFKNTVMNFPLGGAFNSRINLNLREEKGYTYGARSFFNANKYNGTYQFSSNIKKEATDSAIAEFMKEVVKYKNEGISEEELSFTKSSILLSKALDYETPFQKLGFLSSIIEYDLPSNYTSEQEKIINALTVADINALAKANLKPEEMLIVVVGHAYKIREGLEKLGYGKIRLVEIN
ncbi:MAG: insulinase family protein [Flavobacteriales bacterium]|nr:insulinase family protein [Flavobacteriales bacterium]